MGKKTFAESKFEKYRLIQDRSYQSDFDRLLADCEEMFLVKNQNRQGTTLFQMGLGGI